MAKVHKRRRFADGFEMPRCQSPEMRWFDAVLVGRWAQVTCRRCLAVKRRGGGR